jgi:hypothetical protein
MKRMKILSLSLIALGTAGVTSAQVHIGDATDAHDGAILDLTNPQNKGLLLPNVALKDSLILTVGEVTTPGADGTAKGMVVFNTNAYRLNGKGIYVWNGNKWCTISASGKDPGFCMPDYYDVDATKFVDITVNGYIGSDGIFVGNIPTAQPYTQTTKTLRFLTYNLGANPNLTPKQQMAYVSSGNDTWEDITVFGGFYQWGRKDTKHTLRCDTAGHSDRFTTTPYSSLAEATEDGKFVLGYEGISPPVHDLWGNGGGLAGQTNLTYTGTQNAGNPCPAGFRVPTQHEWALLGQEGGSSTSITDDGLEHLYGIASITPTSGITWVHVIAGMANGYWLSSPANGKPSGIALYKEDDWANALADYKNGSLPLTNPEAPNPLMFLPGGGCRSGSYYRANGGHGNYWSSTINSGTPDESMLMAFAFQSISMVVEKRTWGCSVRCVSE